MTLSDPLLASKAPIDDADVQPIDHLLLRGDPERPALAGR